MRTQSIRLHACMALCLLSSAPVLAEEIRPELGNPVEVALIQKPDGRWTYVSFPGSFPLYVYDGDKPGKSNCNRGCASAWPPVPAGDDAATIGLWTPIIRDDGSKQWAYQNRPVYVRYHDIPGDPQGAGQKGWRLIDDLVKTSAGTQ
ncbi:MAG: ATP-binding protein [Amphiplicatus sp.]